MAPRRISPEGILQTPFFDMDKEADCIEQAVNAVLDAGYRTADCMSEGCTQLSCSAMEEKIREQIC